MNKNVKRIFSVFLCVMMIFSLFTVTSFAEENNPSIKLSVDGEIAVGNVVRLLVGLENMPDFTQADFRIDFDSSSIECQGITKPVKCNTELWVSGMPEDGVTTCSIHNYAPIKGQVDIATIVFKVLDTTDTTVRVSVSGLDCSDVPEILEFNMQKTNDSDSSQTYLDYSYEIINSEAVIIECNKESTGDIVIPDSIDGYPVTTIKEEAFINCNKITGVVIPDSVTAIEDFAFSNCESLVNVTIGGGVKTLGMGIFVNCKNLENVVVKNGVPYISNQMFSACNKLKKISLPDSIRKIEADAFRMCSSLAEIHIPEYTEVIEGSAFYMCSSLVSIRLPKKVTKIESYTFYKCESLEMVFYDGILTEIGEKAFAHSGLNGFDVPGTVEKIGNSAFYDCKKLITVNIGYGVKTIESYAFFGCTWLKDIAVPASVNVIELNAIGYDGTPPVIYDFSVYGLKGSAAEEYAISNNLPFVESDAENVIGVYDVNRDGNISAGDARLALRASAKLEVLEGNSFIAADIDKNGKITASDARLILRKSAKLD